MKRAVQLAIVEGMERPVGGILPSVITGNNDDLIRQVAPLYLNGLVLDTTYGEGAWWKKFKPSVRGLSSLTDCATVTAREGGA